MNRFRNAVSVVAARLVPRGFAGEIRSLARAGILMFWLASPSPASPGNLVLNGNFASGVTGWTVPGFAAGFARSATVVGNTGSGSAVEVVAEMPEYLRSLRGVDGNIAAVSQCVTVMPGQRYDLSGDALIPDGQEGRGHVELEVVWWRTEGCVMTSSSVADAIFANVRRSPRLVLHKTWKRLEVCGAEAPAGAVAAEVSLHAINTDVAKRRPFRALFTDVRFGIHSESCVEKREECN